MSRQSLAAVATAPHEALKLEALQLDDPRPDEVVVEIRAAGICHTDLSARDQHLPFPLPGVLGHEGAGVVVEIGHSVTGVQVGDRVVMSQMFCNTCAECVSDHVTSCEQAFALGFGGRRADGTALLADERGGAVGGAFLGQSSFATHALSRAVNVFKLPDDIAWEIAAPLGCGVQTGTGAVLNLLRPDPGSSIAVFGAGTVGLSALLAAVHRQCEIIVAVDVNTERLAIAKELGSPPRSLSPRAFVPNHSSQCMLRLPVKGAQTRGGIDDGARHDAPRRAALHRDLGGRARRSGHWRLPALSRAPVP